jgi:calcium-dependent protein kinase
MRTYQGVSHFRRTAMNILIKMSSEEEIMNLSNMFKALDHNNEGMINAAELHDYITKSNIEMSDTQINEMIENLDYAGNGKINYSEFLAATVDVMTFVNDQKLRSVFSMFDTSNKGSITAADLHFAF